MRLTFVLLWFYCAKIILAQNTFALNDLIEDLRADSIHVENADYYVIGPIKMNNPVVIKDKISGFDFIKDIKGNDAAEINSAIKQNNQQLLSCGWSLTFTFTMLFNSSFDIFKKDAQWGWYFESGLPLKPIENVKCCKRYEAYMVSDIPEHYLLILVKGEYFQQFTYDRVLDPMNHRFQFKDPQAYYQIIMPIFLDQKVRNRRSEIVEIVKTAVAESNARTAEQTTPPISLPAVLSPISGSGATKYMKPVISIPASIKPMAKESK